MSTPSILRMAIDHFFVGHTGFAEVHDHVRQLIEQKHSSAEADCLLVTGPPGTGKTTLRRKLKGEYPRIPDDVTFRPPGSPSDVQADRIPVVFVEIPAQPRPLPILQSILRELGDPRWMKGRFHEASNKIDAFLPACGTVAIVFDEVQRLVDAAGVVTSEAVVEEIKRIHGEHGVSLIFLGLGRIRYLFEQDSQLRDRWSVELRLEPFRCFQSIVSDGQLTTVRREADWAAWCGVLKALQITTGLQSTEDLWAEPMARRLYYATAGILRRLKILLKLAVRLLPEGASSPLSLETLSHAYALFARHGEKEFNPFCAEIPDDMPLPIIEDDYKLRPKPEQRRAQKRKAASNGGWSGAQIAAALRP